MLSVILWDALPGKYNLNWLEVSGYYKPDSVLSCSFIVEGKTFIHLAQLLEFDIAI